MKSHETSIWTCDYTNWNRLTIPESQFMVTPSDDLKQNYTSYRGVSFNVVAVR